MKSFDAQSCRALKSRGSRTSRRIVSRTSTNGLPNQEAVPRILFCAQRNTPIFICDSPALLGEGWGGGIARHSQIKGLFFKRIQRRAPSLTLPHEGATRGEGILCVLSNSLTRPTSRTARLGGFASIPHILIEYIYRFAATKGIAAGNREMQVRRSSGSQRGLGSLSLPLAGRS